MSNNSIGIMDSGVGGFSVWKEIIHELPNESTIYIADSKNIPYGTRTAEEIYELAGRLVAFLLTQQVKMVVVACNTITVTGLERLRQKYPMVPIIGTVPVIKTAAEVTKSKRIGVLSTVRTNESEYQKKLIETFAQDCLVTTVGTDLLVPFVERGELEGANLEAVIRRVVEPFKQADVDTVALACTHFPFLEAEIWNVLGNAVRLLEPSSAIARHAKRVLTSNDAVADQSHKPEHRFFTTGDKDLFADVLAKLLPQAPESYQVDTAAV